MTASEPFRSEPPARTDGAQLATTSYEVRPGVTVVTVAGELDLSTEPDLEAALAAAVADPTVRLLVCDLSDALYVSCGALSVLVRAYLDLGRRGARLRVVAWRPIVVRLIDLTGTTEMLELHDNLTQACTPPP